jgi:acetyl-CoA carboxylase alpha subunit
MLKVQVPVLSLVTGEGGSGGALAFAAGDRLVAYERSIFSVIGPEGAAEILWRDPARVQEAARALKLTAADLKELGIADDLVPGIATIDSIKYLVADTFAQPTAGDAPRRRARWRKELRGD